ncbi:L,D-transpeptidase [Streptomyces sp. TRM64462]|uniref:L,D-transpeptidase family protein n=1 Tax=Streptomyces sp. TRM64462 TaxID=2741726 RepID=UPI00158636A5|nr:L,D-transpeptidase family protein [Streptomyces sp. TRM64462]
MRTGPVIAAALLLLLPLSAARAAEPPPLSLPARLADTGGGTQLITAEAPDPGATAGTVTWWERRGDRRWVKAGSAPARFGAGGLVAGERRRQGTSTTPAGLYDLRFGFGIEAPPPGTAYPYRRVTRDAWWCQDNASASYNRWVRPLPADCRAEEAEHLITYGKQYAYGVVIGFNYERPVRGRGAGIFLHVNGDGPTAGCVSVPKDAMARILTWLRAGARPHIAIGTASGSTAITRY